MRHAPDFVEVINPYLRCGGFRAVLFDFDGTLSLLREGWPAIMTRMMVSVLQTTPRAENTAELTLLVDQFIMSLNGKSTIHQMNQLALEVRKRGGMPREPLHYKQVYIAELMEMVLERREAVTQGTAGAQQWSVPGSHRFLKQLTSLSMSLTLASGTDREHVVREAELLGLAGHFGSRIFAPVHEEDGFSKQNVITELLRESRLPGTAVLGFGDGMVETAEVKKVGGVAIGVASDLERPGHINGWKRQQLVKARADAIIADYSQTEALVQWLFQ